MKKSIITLGIIGFILSPVRWALHATHNTLDYLGLSALQAELRLEKSRRQAN